LHTVTLIKCNAIYFYPDQIIAHFLSV